MNKALSLTTLFLVYILSTLAPSYAEGHAKADEATAKMAKAADAKKKQATKDVEKKVEEEEEEPDCD